jgi:pentatricopeptide repeat protein
MESAEVPGGLAAYLALLTAYGRLRRARDAQRTFDRMHLKGFRGDLKAFTALMEAYSNTKDHSNAELIFQSLRAAGLKPDDKAFVSLVSVFPFNLLNGTM